MRGVAGAIVRAGGRVCGSADGRGRTQGILSGCGNRAGLGIHITYPLYRHRATSKELLPQEGSAPLGIDTEPSRSLVWVGGDPHEWGGSQIRWADWRDSGVMLFALDDATEEREWESVHTEVGSVVHALTTALSSLRDVIAPVGQV